MRIRLVERSRRSEERAVERDDEGGGRDVSATDRAPRESLRDTRNEHADEPAVERARVEGEISAAVERLRAVPAPGVLAADSSGEWRIRDVGERSEPRT